MMKCRYHEHGQVWKLLFSLIWQQFIFIVKEGLEHHPNLKLSHIRKIKLEASIGETGVSFFSCVKPEPQTSAINHETRFIIKTPLSRQNLNVALKTTLIHSYQPHPTFIVLPSTTLKSTVQCFFFNSMVSLAFRLDILRHRIINDLS